MVKKLNRLAKPSGRFVVITPSGRRSVQPLNAWQKRNFKLAGFRVIKA